MWSTAVGRQAKVTDLLTVGYKTERIKVKLMKIHISQLVKIEGDNFPYTWTKEYGDRTVIPHKGDKIEDPLWKDPYEYDVVDVVLDYGEDTCFVTVAPYESAIPKERMEEFGRIAGLHGWEAGWMKYRD